MIFLKKPKAFHIWYTCSQIWLNYFVDDHHFGYITESLLLPQEYRRILLLFLFCKSFQIWYVERFAQLFSGWLHHKILRKTLGLLGPNY
jgi:hypothetical protein